jgi:hypothetical protein
MVATDPWERTRQASMAAGGSLPGSFTRPALQSADWGQATLQADFVDGSGGGGLCSFVEVLLRLVLVLALVLLLLGCMA